MKEKYFRQKLDGTIIYPQELTEIKSREDLQRWFEWSSQFERYDDYNSLLAKLKTPYTENITKNNETNALVTNIIIMFPRCKYTTTARFFGKDCFSIDIN